MIGSPAARGAVASVGGAERAGPAAASGLNAVSAAIAASVTMAGGPQRRIAKVDCTVVNRFTMPCLVGMLSAFASIECQIAMSGYPTAATIRRQFAPGDYRHVSVAILSYPTTQVGGRVARGRI